MKIIILLLAVLWRQAHSAACPNECSGNGRCIDPGNYCQCFAGYTAPDCSERICAFGNAWVDMAQGVDNAHNMAECSNMGLCTRSSGICSCRTGFEGNACQRKSCPNACNSAGKCQSMQYYASRKDPGLGTVFPYTDIWDAEKMHGCSCDEKYNGPDCSLRNCSRGDDPLTGVGVSTAANPNQVNEIQKVTCKAGGGTFTITFRKKTSAPIPYDAKATELQAYLEAIPTIGAGNINLIMYSSQACKDAGVSWTVEFKGAFGSLPLLTGDITKLTFSDLLSVPYIVVVKQVDGTKESLSCSGRGICDTTSGVCSCSTSYATSNGYNLPGTRGDCGYATATIQVCPGVLACSGHGQCKGNPTYKCVCQDGYTGADCSLRTCPKDVAWFTYPFAPSQAHLFEQEECSAMGICDRVTGLCSCMTGYTGSACEIMACPGEASQCSGKGTCLSMRRLATLATINGEPAGFTYGRTPNKPSTWDANKIMGCLCDDGYTGYDCSLRTCPYGDDPVTVHNNRDEVQHIKCANSQSSGSIVFTFRKESSLPVPANTNMAGLKAALQSVKTIGNILVELVNQSKPDSLCLNGGNAVRIVFLTTHGDLPLIHAQPFGVDSVTVDKIIPGNKEMIECSGRGICDRTTGKCECFSGYGSSDGHGNRGLRRDCGFILDVLGSTSLLV